ncbi:hypothetical protein [uncultured Trichococcus sp.]|nr:hypothetical protein [uncultured Trichococcus sp.]
MAFLDDGRIGIDSNPAENAKANGVDFYEYIKKNYSWICLTWITTKIQLC